MLMYVWPWCIHIHKWKFAVSESFNGFSSIYLFTIPFIEINDITLVDKADDIENGKRI